ncbi:MAG: LysM peptidoglycan-binding domain-containing protein, partial [Anaerolineae bacterium]|nr:LysM peptidoglycan-binding domain-containing protein [Anaerolineae bacterium]
MKQRGNKFPIYVFFCAVILISLFASVTPALAAEMRYTVKPGDTLYSISRRYNVNVSELATANGLTLHSWLYTGQQLVIPGMAAESPQAPASAPDTEPATNTGIYTVKVGDTLLTIAARHGLRVSQLAVANGLAWNTWVYTGQQLTIPGAMAETPETDEPSTAETPAEETPTEEETPATTSDGVYVVKAGDNLFRIALRHNVTLAALKAANGLYSDIVYVGQRLTIPAPGTTPVAVPAAPATTYNASSGEKWIDVNLSTQTIVAYQGQTAVYSAHVSTGLWGTPTAVGTFAIYVKYISTPMSGPGYYLPNVPHTMY